MTAITIAGLFRRGGPHDSARIPSPSITTAIPRPRLPALGRGQHADQRIHRTAHLLSGELELPAGMVPHVRQRKEPLRGFVHEIALDPHACRAAITFWDCR